MSRRLTRTALALGTLLAFTPVLADDLTGTTEILCSNVYISECLTDGECVTGPPWNWNVPQFVEIDLEDETIRTTKASGENRSTPLDHVHRENGLIYVFGKQGGRAFMAVINEQTGMSSGAVTADGLTLALFGACTPRNDDE